MTVSPTIVLRRFPSATIHALSTRLPASTLGEGGGVRPMMVGSQSRITYAGHEGVQ